MSSTGRVTYIGENWNTTCETVCDGVRTCPHCGGESLVRIVAGLDYENFTCPRCRSRVSSTPQNGKYGRQVNLEKTEVDDRTKPVFDLHRTTDRNRGRKNLTPQRRKELGLE